VFVALLSTLTDVVFLVVRMVLNVTGSVATEVDAEQTRVKTRAILTTSMTDRCLCLSKHNSTYSTLLTRQQSRE